MKVETVEDVNSAEIARSKFMADGIRYFGLFDGHIPSGIRGNVLLVSLGNVDCLTKIMEKNPAASYVVVDGQWVLKCLTGLGKEFKAEEGLDVYNIIKGLDMKFDCIVMNPPYSRNLHLKILVEAIKHLKDDGVCVCLHPSKWIRRFDYWKTKAIIPVKSVKFLTDVETCSLFDAAIGSQLMITVAAKDGSLDYKKYSRFISWVKEKIIDKAQWLFNNPKCPGRTTNSNEKFILNLPIVHGHIGCCDMAELTSKDYNIALKSAFGKRPQDINSFAFNSEEERKNFYNSLFTQFYKFLIVICRDGQTASSCYYAIPWLGDAINPRTGLKGYQGEWTNVDFYQYFNITSEEQKMIEETMEKYK